MSDWRFMIDNEGTILRGRTYRVEDPDNWSYYWDGDGFAAFYDEGYRGIRGINTDEDTERAVNAYRTVWEMGGDTDEALTKVARRITGNWSARFVRVPLDQGMDFYALAWVGDPDNEWRDEIENVWHGEVYRCEVASFYPHLGEAGEWAPTDDMCEEWYGEDNAEAAMLKAFPLDAFPQERLIQTSA